MKQHMLTHKIRDMFGNSNSGDESRMSSNSETTQRPCSKEAPGQINFAIKLEKSPNHNHYDDEKSKQHSSRNSENGSPVSYTSAGGNGTDYSSMSKEAEMKKWCNKLNEMPENIAAS